MESSSPSTQVVQEVRARVLVSKSVALPRRGGSNASRSCVEVCDQVYAMCWCGVWFLHSCCALYLIKLAQLYWYLDHPYLTYYANLIQPESDRHFKEAGVVFGIVGVAHMWCVIDLVVISFLAKELVLSHEDLPSGAATTSSMKRIMSLKNGRKSLYRASSASRFAHFAETTKVLKSWWNMCFGRNGVFGLDSVFFDILFLTREFLEIVLQSFQVRQTSEMIATVWLNRFFVLLVVVNCWTTPLVQRVFYWYPALGRLAGITIDLGLTIGMNMVIPVIIFLPYMTAWDSAGYTFDADLLYDDLWFTNMVMENRLLFTRSLFDFIAKIVPHVSIYISLGCIKMLLVRARVDGRRVLPGDDRGRGVQAPVAAQVRSSQSTFSNRFRLGGWKTLISHTLLVLWGMMLLGLHISATLPSDHEALGGCKQAIRVWFSTKNTCTTYEYNCYRRRDDIALVDVLKGFESSTLLSLIISHCEDLVVPREIRDFPNLISFELFNVTLREWSADAAISSTIHTSLVALVLAKVNMTALPDGVRGPLPESLSDIEIAYTNLTSLPDDLHESWHELDVLYLEFSSIRTFPATLTQLAVYDLSLIGNHLETAPELQAISIEMYTLALSHNPLRELPSALHDDAAFGFLSVENTRLTALPAWVNDARVLQETAFAKGSPVCAVDASSSSSSSSSGASTVQPLDGAAWPRVDCESGDPRSGGRYPLATMLPRRAP